MSYIDDILSEALASHKKSSNTPMTIDGKPVGSQEWLDPDTVKVDGETVRIKGYNAPEVAHIKAGVFTPRQYLDDTSAEDVQEVIQKGGYTNIVRDGKDKYKRTVGSLQNKDGSDLGDTLTKLGLQETNAFSNPQAVSEGAAISAAANVFPNVAVKDPLVALGLKRQEERKGSYTQKISVADEKAYAGFKNAVGVGPAADFAKEVERLEGILKDQSLRPDLRIKLSKQLDEAKQAVFLASTTPDVVGNVLVRHKDRTIMNEAHNQFSTSLNNAMLDSLKSVGGILEMTGDNAKWEWLKEQGQIVSRKAKLQQEDLPTTLSSFRDINTDTTWDTISDTATYVGNLFAGTLPSMAILVGSTLVAPGAGLTAFGLSTIPPSLMYAGNFYADQENKNAGLAMALGFTSGVLDRIGLEGITGGNLLTISGKEAIINNLIQAGKASSKSEAMKLIEEASKKTLVELSQAGAEFAKHQIASKEAMVRGLASLSRSVGGEAGTEYLQQLAEIVAKKGDWNLDAQYDKGFYDQLLDAAVGGGAMGGTIGAAMQTKDNAQWHAIADGMKKFEGTLTEAQQYQAENAQRLKDDRLDTNGNRIRPVGFESIEDAANFVKLNTADDSGNKPTLKDMQVKSGAWNGIKSIITDPFRLLRQLSHTAVPSIMNEDGTFKENLAILKAIMGGHGILPGDHAEGYKQRLIGRWHGTTAERLANDLGTSVKDANKQVKETWQNVWSKGGRLDDSNPLQKWFDSINNIREDIKNKAGGYVDISDVMDTKDLFESSTVNPQVLRDNRERVIQTMVRSGKATRRQATEAIQNILSGDYHKGSAAKKFMSQAGVFDDPSLNNVFENNVFASIENLKERMATHLMHSKYLGRDGEILAKLLHQAKANGELTDAEYDNTVKEVKDYFDIITGNYHPLDKYPRLEKVLSWGATLTMLASLSKAAISSQVEVAMATLGTPADLINKQLGVYAKTYAAEYANDVNKFNSWTLSTIGISSLRKVTDRKVLTKVEKLEKRMEGNPAVRELEDIQNELEVLYKQQFGRRLFEHLGYNDTGYNSMGKFEYNNLNMRRAMHAFASAITLRAQTDANRMAVLSVSADIVLGKLASLAQIPKEFRESSFATGRDMSKEQMQSLAELQQYGADVNMLLDFVDSVGVEEAGAALNNSELMTYNGEIHGMSNEVQANLLTTLGNMVDSRIVNPQAANLPKYFHDPRLRVLTIMSRFMAAAHAVILPRLYKQYLLDGNVGMKYQAFSTVCMALIFGHFANILKDMISYDEGDNPYVKGTRKNIQRVLNSSGLLGQYERLVDKVSPVYPNSSPDFSKSPGLWAVDKVTDASPIASWAAKPVRGVMNLAEGETEKGVRQLVRAAPVVGSFPVAAGNIASLFKEN